MQYYIYIMPKKAKAEKSPSTKRDEDAVKRELEEDLKLLRRETSSKHGDKEETKETSLVRYSSSQRAGKKVVLSRRSSSWSKQSNKDMPNPLSITGKRATRSKICLIEHDGSSSSDFYEED